MRTPGSTEDDLLADFRDHVADAISTRRHLIHEDGRVHRVAGVHPVMHRHDQTRSACQRQIDRLLDEAEAAISQSDWALAQDRSQNVPSATAIS